MRSVSSVIILLVALIATSVSAYEPIGQGGDCTGRPNKCDKGLYCLGPEGKKKCKPFRLLGQRCGQDPYWICAKGLTCQWRCRISQGYGCTDNPNWCARGLHCVGRTKWKRCEKPVGLGGTCLTKPWLVCASGLTCDDYKCKLEEGENCAKTPYLCASGLKCLGYKDEKYCTKPSPAGGSCGYGPYSVCEHGLKCEYNTCVIPRGGDCTGKEYCGEGLRCVGPDYKKRCEYPLPIGKPCTGDYDYCALGLVCGGLGKARRCIDGGDEGRVCRPGNPKLQCDEGLRCVKGFCRY